MAVSKQHLTPNEDAEEEDDEDYEQVDVPYEYEVEEVQERPVVKEELIEKAIPQVKAMYRYQGQGMAVEKGEVTAFWISEIHYHWLEVVGCC